MMGYKEVDFQLKAVLPLIVLLNTSCILEADTREVLIIIVIIISIFVIVFAVIVITIFLLLRTKEKITWKFCPEFIVIFFGYLNWAG